mmetsp:Transcript_100079/g.298679  ORF Transcript_100079/g.298679 Transcript_100079/m.298679 type:complete len:292 (-) Transcript_100079:619-1494(-)
MLLLPSRSMVKRRFFPIFPSSSWRSAQSFASEATIASAASSLLERSSTSVSESSELPPPFAALSSRSCFFKSWTSCCSFFTRLSLSTPVATFATSLMFFTVEANFSVLKLSSKFCAAGLKVPIMAVRELPLRALDNSSVSLEFRNLDISFTCGFSVIRRRGTRGLPAPAVAEVLRFSGAGPPPPWPPRLWMQVVSHMRLRLMKLSSTSLSPLTWVVFSFSRPARSAKYTSELSVMLSPPPFFSMRSLKTVWPRELCTFMAVECTVFIVLPYSMSVMQSWNVSTGASVAPVR